MKMNYNELFDAIKEIPVWDTHTHLETNQHYSVESIWDVVHYFWFFRELRAAGYPDEPMAVPEKQRVESLVESFAKASNTYWSWAVRNMLKQIYEVEINDSSSVYAADEKIKDLASESRRSAHIVRVCDELNIQKINVGDGPEKEFAPIKERMHTLPVFHVKINELTSQILNSRNQRETAEEVGAKFEKSIQEEYDKGNKTLRLEPAPAVQFDYDFSKEEFTLKNRCNTENDVKQFIWQSIFKKMDSLAMGAQLFIGMIRQHMGNTIDCTSLNDPKTLYRLHPLFARFPNCKFEFVNAAELSNLDLVQSSRLFTNVFPGGMWWFNFRASTYTQAMQYRLEALPASRCMLVSSDARHIEWGYTKIYLVKKLLTQFLARQIDEGWLDKDAALTVAREWLFETARKVYTAK